LTLFVIALTVAVNLILYWPRPESRPQPAPSVPSTPDLHDAVDQERSIFPKMAAATQPVAWLPVPADFERQLGAFRDDNPIGPCQYCEPGLLGVEGGAACGEPRWNAARPIPWEAFGPGEYVGPHRMAHVPEYRLRPNDQLQIIFRESRERTDTAYRLNVGDEVKVELLLDKELDRNVTIQPDGTITLRLLNQVPAAGRTVEELRADIEERYRKYYNDSTTTVTPMRDNTRLKDLLAAIRVNFGNLAQGQDLVVTPEGTIQLVGLGSVYVQGLTLSEAKMEIDERYRAIVGDGLDATPVLRQRAPRFVFVLGEVRIPGQFPLQGPTTVSQAIAMAGGWNVGANLRQIVIFRRNDDWRLMATKIDLAGALYGERPNPSDEIFVRDSDVVLLPKSPILRADDWISLIFTRGLYSALPGLNSAYSVKASQL
jgi:polysaccharide export outer membrane protein